jgi:hypothetical protein
MVRLAEYVYVFGGSSWVDYVADVHHTMHKLNVNTFTWHRFGICPNNALSSFTHTFYHYSVRQRGRAPHSRFAHAAVEVRNFVHRTLRVNALRIESKRFLACC